MPKVSTSLTISTKWWSGINASSEVSEAQTSTKEEVPRWQMETTCTTRIQIKETVPCSTMRRWIHRCTMRSIRRSMTLVLSKISIIKEASRCATIIECTMSHLRTTIRPNHSATMSIHTTTLTSNTSIRVKSRSDSLTTMYITKTCMTSHQVQAWPWQPIDRTTGLR